MKLLLVKLSAVVRISFLNLDDFIGVYVFFVPDFRVQYLDHHVTKMVEQESQPREAFVRISWQPDTVPVHVWICLLPLLASNCHLLANT
jgi:hypothetical protein